MSLFRRGPQGPKPPTMRVLVITSAITLFLLVSGVQAFSGPVPWVGWLYLAFGMFNLAVVFFYARKLRRHLLGPAHDPAQETPGTEDHPS